MAAARATTRPLTDFEQVLLGLIAAQPRSGYGLRKLLTTTPASVYQPSPGALYPALRRLADRGLLRAQTTPSSGRRAQRLYSVTNAGRAAHLSWLRQPVDPATVTISRGLLMMRFTFMEDQLTADEVAAFLADLADALESFIATTESYVAADAEVSQRHAVLALEHGLAVARASLQWALSAREALAEPCAAG
jgi:PadR family transcriptional regulator, regulatory protein AphA